MRSSTPPRSAQRLRARLRFGLEAELGYGWTTGFRLATGNLRDPVSTNQTLGNTAGRYTIGVDQAYIRHIGVSHSNRQQLTFTGGRMANPWLTTDLIFDNDLTFEGLTANYRIALQRDELFNRFVFLTLGGFPIEEFEDNAEDKWMLGGQLGMEYRLASGSRLRLAGAYYDYRNLVGQRNVLDSNLLDYTAPKFLQRGNTLFDIRNDADGTTNLFALAAEYRLVDVTAGFDWRLSPGYRLAFSGNYVQQHRLRGRRGQSAPGARHRPAHRWLPVRDRVRFRRHGAVGRVARDARVSIPGARRGARRVHGFRLQARRHRRQGLHRWAASFRSRRA